MDWGATFILLALAVFAGLYVGLPLARKESQPVSDQEQTRSVLLARREQVLDSLAELEFDYATGKVSESHYQQRRQALMQEGAAILQQLDALQPPTPQRRRKPQRRTVTPPPQTSDADDPIEALLAARRRARAQKPAGFCPQCGAPVAATDRFCPRCGTPLKP